MKKRKMQYLILDLTDGILSVAVLFLSITLSLFLSITLLLFLHAVCIQQIVLSYFKRLKERRNQNET